MDGEADVGDHPLAEPGEPATLDRLGQAWTRDEDVVVPGGNAFTELLPGRSKAPLQSVPLDRATKLARHRETESWFGLYVLRARERVEDEVACGDRAALAVDRVEVA